MNSFIETLNQWGKDFLTFAWPMLWQSSLLIVVLFVFEYLFRRKVRASMRYALWLVVLVKLCVPPSFALPTSPAWWLHKNPPPVVAKPVPHYTVTYENGSLPEMPMTPLPAFVPPNPVMTYAAWLLTASIIVSLTLLLWLLVRWWQITRLVNRAKTSHHLIALANETQKLVNLKFSVPVKLTTNSMSPAVCGLFRPAILIPQSLEENFLDEQLRAVLLHELIHLRRRDVWVNFVQALLQIIYWWHPLVWLANAHIRRVREEAVDDAVMLALRDQAESYAPTLLEVAKLALNRPLASLGLVGILESRHALRQRIERLIDFRPPRQAGLTLISLLGILAFTAVAVPIGDGPSSMEKPSSPTAVISPPPASIQKTNMETVLITASFYQMRATDFEKMVSGLKFNQGEAYHDSWWSASPDLFRQLTNNPELSGLKAIVHPRIQTFSGSPVDFYVGKGTSGTEIHCEPFVVNELVYLAISGKVVEAPDGIAIITKAAFTNQFGVKATAENHGGIVLRVEKLNGSAESNLVLIADVQIITNVPTSRHQRVGATNIAGILDDPNYRVVLNALEQRSSSETLAEPEVITTSGRGVNRISTDNISVPLSNPASESSNQMAMTFNLYHPIRQEELKEKLLTAGVNIPPAVFFYRDNGMFLVRATKKQLALVQRLVLKLNGYASSQTNADYDQFIKQIGDIGFEQSSVLPLTNLFSRHFRVNTNTFAAALRKNNASETDNIPTMAKNFFSTLGVNFELPGKAVFYSDGLGELFVKATKTDLDIIENAMTVFESVLPQVHIKARFLEVPKESLALLKPFPELTNGVRIISAATFRKLLQTLESKTATETLAEPEVVTFSGRQTQFRSTAIQTIVTNLAFQETSTNASGFVPQTESIETGPVLDVVPYVLSDGYTVNLTVIPSMLEFLGYDTPAYTNRTEAYNRAGEKIDLPKILPRISVRQAVATLNLWDGQTGIISGLPEKNYVNGKEVANKSKASDKELLVFVTATIVDPAGNRIHSDEAVPANIYDPVILR